MESLIYEGSLVRLHEAMDKAAHGERTVIGYIGGSITMGSLSSTPKTCYAYLSFRWWQQHFPGTELVYVNAGIGGTSSHFGAARVREDLLLAQPDVVFVEFSVNDENTAHFQETYEGLVRQILYSAWNPAVVLLHNVCYKDKTSALEIHSQIGKYYDIPCISFGKGVYSLIEKGQLSEGDITPDGLHPNDRGHRLLADMVCEFLEKAYRQKRKASLTKNRYERMARLQSRDTVPIRMEGFLADGRKSGLITEVFQGGWQAWEKGAEICFQVECVCLGVQYRKTIQRPALKAAAVVDGREEEAVILDGAFEEDWGDCLYLQSLVEGEKKEVHTLKITVLEAPKEAPLPFYLVSLLAAL